MCEKCKKDADICLNGTRWLCWKHYCEAMQETFGFVPNHHTETALGEKMKLKCQHAADDPNNYRSTCKNCSRVVYWNHKTWRWVLWTPSVKA